VVVSVVRVVEAVWVMVSVLVLVLWTGERMRLLMAGSSVLMLVAAAEVATRRAVRAANGR
jgi:hypothetical protein